MTNEQLLALLPFMLLASASIIIILMIAARLSHFAIQVAGFLMLCATVFAMWYVRDILPEAIMPLFVVDGFGALFTGLIVFSIMIIGLFSFIYFLPANSFLFFLQVDWVIIIMQMASLIKSGSLPGIYFFRSCVLH